MTALTTRQRYQRGQATAAQIEGVAREILAELADPDSEASRAASHAGLDPGALTDAHAEVVEGEQGAEPILTTIIVGIAVQAGATVAATLWKEVIWPRIRRRLGADALGAPVAPAKEQ
ncbi:MAG: hypothetical protein ACR2GH_03385 [Pseudonocardia sp.]